MADHDVAIVGAGPVGMLLACLLQSLGVEASVFERGAGHPGSRAIGIHPLGLAALDAAGVGEQVRADALSVDAGTASCRGRVLASLPLSDVLTLPQDRTERALRERLGTGALELERPVLGVVDEGDRVAVDLGERTVSARLLVAADGVHSTVRRCLGMGWREMPGTGRYLMADVRSHDDARRVLLHLEPEGVVESFPLPNGMRRWVARVSDASGASLAELVHARTGERIPQAPASAFVARQHLAGSLARGNVVLLGDAAHEVSPIGGQGMNLGWLGALRLAPSIARALREGRPDLGDYARDMRAAAVRAQRRARVNMAMGAPRSNAGIAARNAVLRALGGPATRGALVDALTMRGW